MIARRGIALPLSLMLVVVVGLLMAVALDRFGSQSLSVNRQVRGYQAHHLGRGLEEATQAWLERVPTSGVASAISEIDGHAFDLTLPDGSVFRVYLTDGQGTLLGDVLGLRSDEALNAAAAFNALLDRQPPAIVEASTRRVGPAAVSVNSASDAVLDAVLRGLLPGDQAATLIRELARARGDNGEITREDLSTALGAANLEPALRQTVASMLTTQPELWLASIDLIDRRGRLLRRYEGYISLEEQEALAQPSAFLTFDEVPVEYPPLGGTPSF